MRFTKPFAFPAFFTFLVCVFAAVHSMAAEPLATGKGDFPYVEPAIGASKPVHVWYYKPAGLDRNAKVMFVMHGVDRNGEKYRDRWARQYLFSPLP